MQGELGKGRSGFLRGAYYQMSKVSPRIQDRTHMAQTFSVAAA